MEEQSVNSVPKRRKKKKGKYKGKTCDSPTTILQNISPKQKRKTDHHTMLPYLTLPCLTLPTRSISTSISISTVALALALALLCVYMFQWIRLSCAKWKVQASRKEAETGEVRKRKGKKGKKKEKKVVSDMI